MRKHFSFSLYASNFSQLSEISCKSYHLLYISMTARLCRQAIIDLVLDGILFSIVQRDLQNYKCTELTK